MTSRVASAYAAIAALALMTSGVTSARAVDFCDVNPNRCQYTPSGKGYYYPQGYRLPSETPGLGAGNAASGQAWGCAATDGKAKGWSGGYPNRTSALYGALSACTKYGGQCRIITCSSSIHSAAEARAILFNSTHR
jgi:hypothetical protein